MLGLDDSFSLSSYCCHYMIGICIMCFLCDLLGKFKGVRDSKSITAKEMLELLESSDHMDAISTEQNNNTEVLSKETLEKLLDRSDLLGADTSPVEQTEEENKLFKVVDVGE